MLQRSLENPKQSATMFKKNTKKTIKINKKLEIDIRFQSAYLRRSIIAMEDKSLLMNLDECPLTRSIHHLIMDHLYNYCLLDGHVDIYSQSAGDRFGVLFCECLFNLFINRMPELEDFTGSCLIS